MTVRPIPKATSAPSRSEGRSNPGPTASPTEGSFHHGAISRFNAWFFTAFAGYLDHASGRHKNEAFAGLTPGRDVLEIGAGTGANLARLPVGTRLIALEPSIAMHDRLRRRCAEAGIDLELHATGAERIPLPDASVDDVICSLVLCTVRDPDAVLSEVRRVLRPGGRFRFVEHVAAPRRGVRRAVQRSVRRPWGWLFEGCDPARHTAERITAAGFSDVRIERRKLRNSVFWPVNTAIWGIAQR